MPRLKLLLNIGRPDAQRLGLKNTLAGETVDASDDAADELLRNGWATDRFDEVRPAPTAAPHNSAGLPSGPRETTSGPRETTAGPPGAGPAPAGAPAPALSPGPERKADRK